MKCEICNKEIEHRASACTPDLNDRAYLVHMNCLQDEMRALAETDADKRTATQHWLDMETGILCTHCGEPFRVRDSVLTLPASETAPETYWHMYPKWCGKFANQKNDNR